MANITRAQLEETLERAMVLSYTWGRNGDSRTMMAEKGEAIKRTICDEIFGTSTKTNDNTAVDMCGMMRVIKDHFNDFMKDIVVVKELKPSEAQDFAYTYIGKRNIIDKDENKYYVYIQDNDHVIVRDEFYIDGKFTWRSWKLYRIPSWVKQGTEQNKIHNELFGDLDMNKIFDDFFGSFGIKR